MVQKFTSQLLALASDFHGFTMTELLVSMGIFTSLIAIAAPNFIANRPARQLNGAARQVLSELMWARSRAVEENNQFIVFFPTNHSLTILDDNNGNGTADAGEWTRTRDVQIDFPGVTLTKGLGNPDPTFSPRGTAGGTTNITVANPSGNLTIKINATGVVRID
ncbi:MAG: GspH/FimT family pseudopilin [Deltaproteobacteria bacterium]|nr:GspH/FimT family pseudopilin [Deltaproteobacteria bacterium]